MGPGPGAPLPACAHVAQCAGAGRRTIQGRECFIIRLSEPRSATATPQSPPTTPPNHSPPTAALVLTWGRVPGGRVSRRRRVARGGVVPRAICAGGQACVRAGVCMCSQEHNCQAAEAMRRCWVRCCAGACMGRMRMRSFTRGRCCCAAAAAVAPRTHTRRHTHSCAGLCAAGAARARAGSHVRAAQGARLNLATRGPALLLATAAPLLRSDGGGTHTQAALFGAFGARERINYPDVRTCLVVRHVHDAGFLCLPYCSLQMHVCSHEPPTLPWPARAVCSIGHKGNSSIPKVSSLSSRGLPRAAFLCAVSHLGLPAPLPVPAPTSLYDNIIHNLIKVAAKSSIKRGATMRVQTSMRQINAPASSCLCAHVN